MATFRRRCRIRDGHEWDKFEGCDVRQGALKRSSTVPFPRDDKRYEADALAAPAGLPVPAQAKHVHQTGFGQIMNEIARSESALAARIVTTSPDVTVSTNLGPWVNRRGLFARESLADTFREERIASTQRWEFSPKGQHVELGIAEMNLFLSLAAFGLSHSLFGARLLPDRHALRPVHRARARCAQLRLLPGCALHPGGDAVGITLAPEGGAHQSIGTPLIGMAQDGLAAFEPAFVDELAVILARVRLHPARRRGRGVRAQLAARRDRRLGLSAPVDAAGRARCSAKITPALASRHRRRRLLAARARPELPGGGRLYGRDGAGGDPGGRADGGRPARRRLARRHLG